MRFALLWAKDGEVYRCVKKNLNNGKELPITEEDVRELLKQERERRELRRVMKSLKGRRD